MCSCLPSALFIIIIIRHFGVRMCVMWVYVQMCFLHVCKCMCVQVRTRVCIHVKARSWFLESSSAHLHLVFWGRFSHRPQSWPIPANLASQLALGILCPWGLWLQVATMATLLLHDSGDVKSDPHTSVTSTELSPKSWSCIYKTFLPYLCIVLSHCSVSGTVLGCRISQTTVSLPSSSNSSPQHSVLVFS